jgi:tellurite resistance protein
MQMNLASAHYAHEIFGYPRTTVVDPELAMNMGKAVMIVAGADGELSKPEMEAFLGRAACYGAPEEALAAYKSFDYRTAKLEDYVKSDYNIGGGQVLYDAIHVAIADGEFHPDEHKAALKMAKILGVPDTMVAAIIKLIETEIAVRGMRIALLSPEAHKGLRK